MTSDSSDNSDLYFDPFAPSKKSKNPSPDMSPSMHVNAESENKTRHAAANKIKYGMKRYTLKKKAEKKKAEKKKLKKAIADAQLTNDEKEFLKKLTVLDKVWGYSTYYEDLKNFELATHDSENSDLQWYTDPIFRTISKLIRGHWVDPYGIYNKVKGCRVIEYAKPIRLMKEALSNTKFSEQLRELAEYQGTSFQMRIISAFAKSCFDIAHNKGYRAHARMQKFRPHLDYLQS